MVRKDLLEKHLKDLGYKEGDIKPVKYSKGMFDRLFSKFNDFRMEEESYCCNGLECHCWVEVVEEGVWDFTLEGVKESILRNVKYAKKYLYNGRKYGGNRLWVYETDSECYVFIYLRDILYEDYNIWFSKI